MLKPIIILNLKAYREAMGMHVYSILDVVENVAKEFPRIYFVIAPNVLYLKDLAERKHKSLIFAQHADPVPYGARTGHIPINSLKLIGVDGFILNHSERKVSFDTIVKAVDCLLYTSPSPRDRG